METLLTLFAGVLVVGSLSFWLFLAVLMIVFAIGLNKESHTGMFLMVATVIVGFGFVSNINILTYIKENWSNIALYSATYFAIGAVWSVIKFWFYAKKLQDVYEEAKEYWLNKINKTMGTINIEEKKDLFNHVTSELDKHKPYYKAYPLKVSEHKSYLSLATLYWPASLIWTMLDDPLKRLLNFIYKKFQNIYQRISDSTSKDYKNDFSDLMK